MSRPFNRLQLFIEAMMACKDGEMFNMSWHDSRGKGKNKHPHRTGHKHMAYVRKMKKA